jgi:cytochrome c oxidase subunit 2
MIWKSFPLFPESASTTSGQLDALYLYLVAVSGFFTLLIFCLVLYFAVRYRRRSDDEQPQPMFGDMRLEVLWSVIPLVLALSFFGWGAHLFFKISRPPANSLKFTVVAKQWMWKIQHPTGQREINDLHIPLGQPVQLTMTSEDVIHSFYVPAFRVKQDVLPGRYTTMWFEATKPGKYHLFCAEYCGTKHAGMGGWVYVMEPSDYERWLSGNLGSETPVEAGARLFTQLGCQTCHRQERLARGPALNGLFGRAVKLKTGQTVTADETYLRESILNPTAKIVEGYEPVMPTYQGQINEEGVFNLIAYIKSLQAAASTEPTP